MLNNPGSSSAQTDNFLLKHFASYSISLLTFFLYSSLQYNTNPSGKPSVHLFSWADQGFFVAKNKKDGLKEHVEDYIKFTS